MSPDSDYDAFAAGYARDNERNPWNAHYERPAVLRLVGDAAGRRVLDAGCGAGALSAALVERGAVVGVDHSSALLKTVDLQRAAHRANASSGPARPRPTNRDGYGRRGVFSLAAIRLLSARVWPAAAADVPASGRDSVVHQARPLGDEARLISRIGKDGPQFASSRSTEPTAGIRRTCREFAVVRVSAPHD